LTKRSWQNSPHIRQHGALQPILVRPLPGGANGFFELVAGARRDRASRIAGRETIPATFANSPTRNASNSNSSSYL
jgi:ParB family chromosome partitioning protein